MLIFVIGMNANIYIVFRSAQTAPGLPDIIPAPTLPPTALWEAAAAY